MQFDKQDLDQLNKAPDWNRPGQYRVEEETCSKKSEKYLDIYLPITIFKNDIND